MSFTAHPATEDDARELVPMLRAQDHAEVLALGREPLEALQESVAQAREAWTYRDDSGAIICMAGVAPISHIGRVGVPWLLGSDLVRAHAPTFYRESRRMVGQWLDTFPVLQNQVPADYTAALRWVKWLGFSIEPAQPFHTVRLMAPYSGVRPSSIAELEASDNFQALLAEYAVESAIKGLPPATAKMDDYRRLDSAGLLHVFSAVRQGRLVGFITVVAPMLLHYSVPVAVSDFFVARAHRKTGAGLRLLRAAEARARELGSPGLLVSAPCEGDLFRVLPRAGYGETSRVFFRSFADV